ncbi:PREDICTED: S1 RNA-binding domain-containing protein 1 [Vollenhovia emeryi]|uniref:S1 RNA-binding domain-containing protein 1 n=1 Tax=Vollenhovia emeryi TaxID=411798 RepID=UPI0005F49EA1|nr:PREDICTED: S1 RNA-binding domain-containing protein 1 [Vollenhovia emeryi]
MKRNLRNRQGPSIIELSDSDDDDCKTKQLKDEDYVVEDSKRKQKITASKAEPRKKRAKRETQSKTVKSVKRKTSEADSETFGNKKAKLQGSSCTEPADVEPQRNWDDLTRARAKEDTKIQEKLSCSLSQSTEWTDVDYISEINNVDTRIVENVVRLFKQDNTIPFIARYRKNMTGSMEPDKLRALLDSFEQAKAIKLRAAAIIKSIDKAEKWSPEIHTAVTSARSLADLEHIYSLYKPGSKRLLAEKARELGLGAVGEAVLRGQDVPPLASLVDQEREGLRNEEEVKSGVVHVIADVISKDRKVFDKVTSLRRESVIEIQTTRCKTTESSKNTNDQKYEQYFNFKLSVNAIKPHHTLAINRAESQKIISVKVSVPDAFERAFKKYCLSRYAPQREQGQHYAKTLYLLNDGIDHAYKKLIKPQMTRRVRSEMKESAEKASIEVFATNVKQLLLTPPVRGKIVLGVDPGYRHGCKLAVVSEQGDVLETGVMYPHNHSSAFKDAANVLARLVDRHGCTIIALGNATACRETELFLTKVIGSMLGSLMYTIVDECGASIYSCSPQAKSEFPDLDPNLVSAVSIARRLQNPLAELVKIEPKHLGVGMYQHDLPEAKLTKTLSEVVTEVVSFVGVDINTASHYLLQRVAGLTLSRSTNIIEWRTKNGPFRNREQLLSVKGIGSKTYEQCAGFIRILPETATVSEAASERTGKKSKNGFNPLDQTWIHPESYAIANRFVKHCQCELSDIGTPVFIERINSHARAGCGALAAQFGTDETTMETIIKALTMQRDEDIRSKLSQPLFRNSVRRIEDLTAGTVLSGVVRNVTHFGAFVDVGVGKEGLIHVTRMKKDLHIGQRVEVKCSSTGASYSMGLAVGILPGDPFHRWGNEEIRCIIK